jgi:hypothetical protein
MLLIFVSVFLGSICDIIVLPNISPPKKKVIKTFLPALSISENPNLLSRPLVSLFRAFGSITVEETEGTHRPEETRGEQATILWCPKASKRGEEK